MIRLVVMMYVKYPLSLRNVEDLLHERGIDICHEMVRLWVDRFGPMFAAEIRKLSQPLQSGAPPHQAGDLQTETLRRTGRVAVSPRLKVGWVWAKCAPPETSCR